MLGRILLDLIQGALTSLDTSMTTAIREEDREWWEEDRQWRVADVAWRELEERPIRALESEHRKRVSRWRDTDREQLGVDNARTLWLRFVEKNRRDVEEKTEQLKAISNISALFALCAVVSLSQVAIPASLKSDSGTWLVAAYAVTVAATECLMILATIICTLILCFIVKKGRTYVDEAAEEAFFRDCLQFWRDHRRGDRPPYPKRTFERLWDSSCEGSWKMAFRCCSWGVSTFFLNLGTIGWIQFAPASHTQVASVVAVGACLCFWGLVQYSWGSSWRARAQSSQASSLPNRSSQPKGGFNGLPFDWHVAPATKLD